MKACVLLGNTREKSNTLLVSEIFMNELKAKGVEVKTFALKDKNIHACIGCDACHDILDSYGCAINDDMQEIAGEILLSDLIIFSSPIYTWFATPSIKAVMDRIFAFTKFPENAARFNLMTNQKLALIATSGDECASNCDLLSEALNRLANYAKIQYLGYFAAQDKGYENMNRKEVADGARAFAEKCIKAINQ